MKKIKSRNVFQTALFNLGRADCKKGIASRLVFDSYLEGYGYQYELDEKSTGMEYQTNLINKLKYLKNEAR